MSQNNPLQYYLLGSGGHASVICEILEHNAIKPVCHVSPGGSNPPKILKKYPHLADEDSIGCMSRDTVRLVNGVGFLPGCKTRQQLYQRFAQLGFCFANVISNRAHVSSYAELGQGVQVFPGAIVQTGAKLGDNCIINSGAIVEHDTCIGAHCHIAPGATICGGTELGDGVFVGANAVVINGLKIGEDAVVGAGACVKRDLRRGQLVHSPRSCFGSN